MGTVKAKEAQKTVTDPVKKDTWRYFAAALIVAGLSNRVIFFIGDLFIGCARIRDFSLPGEPFLPLVPWTIWIYWGIVPWCVLVYYLIAQRERREADRFFAALLLTKAVCLLFFVLFPTTITRPEAGGGSLSLFALRLLYRLDSPNNLFPSVHCLLCWLCWIGVRGKKAFPFWLRAAAFLMAVAVSLSTLTVRQHVLLDVFAGGLLAELGWQLARLPPLRGLYASLSGKLIRLLFRGRSASG